MGQVSSPVLGSIWDALDRLTGRAGDWAFRPWSSDGGTGPVGRRATAGTGPVRPGRGRDRSEGRSGCRCPPGGKRNWHHICSQEL